MRQVCGNCGVDYTIAESYIPGEECPVCQREGRSGNIQEADGKSAIERARKASGSVRVLVCGGRHWSDKAPIRNVLNLIPEIEVLIEGGARGADRLAKKVAGERKIPVKGLSAKWDKHGKAAGPIRNRKMLDEGDPDIVLAFHRNLEKSKGTRDMLQKAVSEGVPAAVCRE